MKSIWIVFIILIFSFQANSDSIIPNLLSCRLTKNLVPNNFKPEYVLIPGKKVDSKTLKGQSVALAFAFVGLNGKNPSGRSDLFIPYGRERELQILHREERRLLLGYFQSASPMIIDLYFPKKGKAFIWLHLLTAHYEIVETPSLDQSSWGECE